MLLKVGFKKRI